MDHPMDVLLSGNKYSRIVHAVWNRARKKSDTARKAMDACYADEKWSLQLKPHESDFYYGHHGVKCDRDFDEDIEYTTIYVFYKRDGVWDYDTVCYIGKYERQKAIRDASEMLIKCYSNTDLATEFDIAAAVWDCALRKCIVYHYTNDNRFAITRGTQWEQHGAVRVRCELDNASGVIFVSCDGNDHIDVTPFEPYTLRAQIKHAASVVYDFICDLTSPSSNGV